MAKFKVGDKVIANEKARLRYSVTVTGWCGYVVAADDRAIKVSKREGEPYGFWVDPDCFDLVTEHSKIVITHDGKTTLARRYVNNKVVDRAEAKCAPCDKFNFAVGASIALDRLLKRSDAKPSEPKYWSGKVVCTHSEYDNDFVVGGIYKCVDGKLIDRAGCKRPATDARLMLSDFAPGGYCDHWLYRFLPIVEENA